MKPVSGLRRAVQRGLLSLVMILLAGTVRSTGPGAGAGPDQR